MKTALARSFPIFITLLLMCRIGLAVRADDTSTVSIRSNSGQGAHTGDTLVVSIRNNPGFSDLKFQMQTLVNTVGFHAVNNFCVVAYQGTDDPSHTIVPYIYWPTQNKMIVWGFGSHLLLGSSIYDLKRDILPGNTIGVDYLNQEDVSEIIKDCKKYGDTYVIKRTVGGWEPIKSFYNSGALKHNYSI